MRSRSKRLMALAETSDLLAQSVGSPQVREALMLFSQRSRREAEVIENLDRA